MISSSLAADPHFSRLKTLLIDSTGLAYYADKDADLADRIARRVAHLGMRDCAAYLELLQGGPTGEAELDALIAQLTIGETYFFRHREQFDALRDLVLPDLLERNQHTHRLHIWSAGCATGAEVYSLSILLRRELGHRIAGWDLSVVGTDINRESLARAREGLFEEWAFRSAPEELKRSCFTRTGKSYLILPEYQEGISFQYHNLVRHPFPSLLNNLSAFDLILCRNVTIYFSPDLTRRVIGQFRESLVDGGWLLVGHAEPNTEFFHAFRAVHTSGAVLYQKDAAPGATAGLFLASLPAERIAPVFPEAPAAWSAPSLPEVMPLAAVPGEQAEELIPAPDLATVRALADRGAWEEADRCCGELLKKDRLNPALHFYHALILEQQGLAGEAEQSLQRALYLERSFVLAHYHLGLLLQRRGKLPQAVRSFENTLRLLSRMAEEQIFAEGDGMTVADLRGLTQIHLELLKET